MTCTINKTDKGYSISCTRGYASHTCDMCGSPSKFLCDFELRNASRKTCDRRLCVNCTTKKEGKDYCKAHLNFKFDEVQS